MRIVPTRRLLFMAMVICFARMLMAQTVGNLYAGYSYFSNELHIDKSLGEVGGYSASGRGNLNGWDVSGEIKLFHWIGAVADFSGSYGSDPIKFGSGIVPPGFRPPSAINTGFYSYLFGPRVSVEVGKIRPFAEALVGVASQKLRLNSVSSVGGGILTIEDSEDDTRLATAFGGGVDYRIARILALRVEADYLGTRLFKGLQLATTTPVQHNVRFSTGIVFRF